MSLLSRKRKIDAVKIYREEYGVGLKEAKDAVDQIEALMRSENRFSNMSYEPTISQDPFANDESNRRRILVMAALVSVAVCGAGIFFLFLSI